MAFKSTLTGSIGTVPTTIHTAIAGFDTTIIGLSLANIHTAAVYCDIKIFKAGGTPAVFLIKNVIIPVSDSFVAIGGSQKLVLQAGDYIQVTSTVAASVDVTISYLEA